MGRQLGDGFSGTAPMPVVSQRDNEQAGIDFVLTYDNPSSRAYLSPPPQQ